MKSKQLILIWGAILCTLLPLDTASAFWHDSTSSAGLRLFGIDLGIPLDDEGNRYVKYGLNISCFEGNSNIKMRGASLSISSFQRECFGLNISLSNADEETRGVSLSIASGQEKCFGLSASLFNHDYETTGLSIGLLSNSSDVTGVQFGMINGFGAGSDSWGGRSKSTHLNGVGIGLLNIADGSGFQTGCVNLGGGFAQLGGLNFGWDSPLQIGLFNGGADFNLQLGLFNGGHEIDFQMGVFNLAVESGSQVGLLNVGEEVRQLGIINYGWESSLHVGLLNMGEVERQFGIVNLGWDSFLQIGVLNIRLERRRDSSSSFQIGLINKTRSGWWIPLSNFGL